MLKSELKLKMNVKFNQSFGFFATSAILTAIALLISQTEFGFQIYSSVQSNETIKIFAILILSLTLIGSLLPFIIINEALNRFTVALHSILPAVGLVGTFIGIFLGLSDFNPADIDGSLPTLLAGLKVAFTTSILGILGSIVVKIISNFHPEIIQENTKTDADFFKLFEKQNRILEESSNEIKELQLELKNVATSFGDATIEHLVSAIQNVMNDFNKKVETQFGENFKRFNEGLASLLVWQREYKEEVNNHLSNARKTQEIIELHEVTSKNLNQMLNEFNQKTKPISDVINKLDENLKSIEISFKAFNSVSEQANLVIPTLESQIKNLNEEVKNQMASTAKNLEKLDEEMAKELEKALNILAANLGALTEQLVKDYQPLMSSLRDVIQIGQKAQKE